MASFADLILEWFQQFGRTHLPWRESSDPYAICVSEFMLQQTQVERVIPKYQAWLEAFPNWEALANANTAMVLRLWSGLGYNSRALRLQKLARTVVAEHQGKLPSDEHILLSLPGIGPYTVAAIRAFAFQQEQVVIDTNIERIVLRFFWGKPALRRDEIAELLHTIIVEKHHKGTVFSRVFFQALMDFGAAVCKAKPVCTICPLRADCVAFRTKSFLVKRPKQSHFAHSRRFYRGQLLKTLSKIGRITLLDLETNYDIQKYTWAEIVQGLKKDGLLTVHEKKQAYITLPEEHGGL